ncbi:MULTISPECIES: motility associated factor glycosyltransferase family protein [Lysinibacillus]|uniref:motility associated factor glycosyltransferase family protein n=1 Tax=Lysinibacillus TaxID=400634 RepID=UPI001CBAECBB|nr:6-hydroxymethylpterin diphosphokinase MptE-like protein [Lysinibacillus sphaericus]
MNLEYNIETIQAKSTKTTLRINGYNIHSKYDPIQEAKIFVDNNYKPGYVHILFGYGLGYIAEEFLKRFINDDEKLIVIEPILTKNVSIEDTRLNIFYERDMNLVKQKIEISFGIMNNITLVCSPNYNKICPEIYKEFLTVLKNKLYLDRVSENTMIALSELWQRNYIYNLKHVVNDVSISKLKKSMSKPVVVASGGPSLTKQLPLLREYRDDFVLIASGSTINTLMYDDIIPDYVVSIDGHKNNFNHFKDLETYGITLLYGMYNHYKIRDAFDNEAYFFLTQSNEVLINHLKDVINEEPVVLKGGGSVAHYAFSIANYISSGPIALIGQDLAYTNNLSHAINNKGLIELSEEEINKRALMKVDGYYKEKVLTDYPFLSMRNTFETLINIYNEQNENIYNCTEGGIEINGFNKIPFKEFCGKFITPEHRKNVKHKVRNKNNSNNILEKLEKEICMYDKLIDILNENLDLISKNKLNDSFEESILERLDINDSEINEIQLLTSLAVIMDPINLNIIKRFPPKINETIEEKYVRVCSQNKVLYEEYKNAVKKVKQYTLNLIEIINKETKGDKCWNQ